MVFKRYIIGIGRPCLYKLLSFKTYDRYFFIVAALNTRCLLTIRLYDYMVCLEVPISKR